MCEFASHFADLIRARNSISMGLQNTPLLNLIDLFLKS